MNTIMYVCVCFDFGGKSFRHLSTPKNLYCRKCKVLRKPEEVFEVVENLSVLHLLLLLGYNFITTATK